MPTKPLIKTKDLGVTYFSGQNNEVKALQDINIEIYPGEFIILFGPSGCGKSTLLYSIAGLQPNVHGDIFFYDKNITAFSLKELEYYHQKQTGMVFQAFYLINSISVAKNVMLPQIAIGTAIAEREKRTIELLEHFGVDKQAHKLPLELSGGQQQRVAICRALVNNPDILLADEPVGNLDTKSAHDVMMLLQELNQKQKKTVILVTHDPSYLSYAHRVFHIRDGKLIKTEINQAIAEIKDEELKSPIPKELELLVRTYSSLQTHQIGNLLIPFKAKQIVSEILTEMTIENTIKIEKQVERFLISGLKNPEDIFELLDKEESKGGIGLDKRAARYLTLKISDIVKEIKMIENEENISPQEKITGIRKYLEESFGAKITGKAAEAADNAIMNRLENKIDKNTVEKMFDFAINKGGAGLDKRIAKKIAQRLELLILGKYK
ncbi:MAG: ABC transporter ATP-binding protein [bacterium]